MRCQCCNRNLNDWESTARHAETSVFLDMCTKCIGETGVPAVGREDLAPQEFLDDDYLEDVEED